MAIRPVGCPLFKHANRQWARKVRGKLFYFGTDLQAALKRWADEKDDLLAGRRPGRHGDLNVAYVINHFLNQRLARLESGEMTQRTWNEYKATGERVVKVFGRTRLVEDLRPEDFERLRAELAKGRGPVTLKNEITKAKVFFRYADMTFAVRVRYGDSFRKPSARTIRLSRKDKFFRADEIRALIAAAKPQLRAMIYLGINCGFGNNDCAKLTLQALDLDKGWHQFARPKTGIDRRCPLWPETIAALQAVIDKRHASESKFVFVTKYGQPWGKKTRANPIAAEMRKLMTKVGQEGRGFYALRHTFQTIGDASGEALAVKFLMGHAPSGSDMSSVYREKVFDDRLRIVTDHVREWLNG